MFALRVFEILHQSQDYANNIQLVLEIIARKYDACHSFIFEISPDGETFSNTFEWCRQGVCSKKEQLQKIPYYEYTQCFANFGEEGLFCCHDLNRLPPAQRELFASQGICSLLQCTLTHAGQVYGFFGLGECRTQRYWTSEQIQALHRCAEVIAPFLFLHRLKNDQQPFSTNL